MDRQAALAAFTALEAVRPPPDDSLWQPPTFDVRLAAATDAETDARQFHIRVTAGRHMAYPTHADWQMVLDIARKNVAAVRVCDSAIELV